jgi:hypothetical protein
MLWKSLNFLFARARNFTSRLLWGWYPYVLPRGPRFYTRVLYLKFMLHKVASD